MQRLSGSRVYLSGAMDRVADGGIGWRRKITPWFNERNVIVLDPSDKPTLVGVEEVVEREQRRRWRSEERYDLLAEHMKPIRHIDLRLVDVADFMVVYLDLSIHACGTYEEVFLANRQRKPILLVCEQGKQAVPDWMYATSNHQLFYNNFEEMLGYLDRVDQGDEVETYGRWVFFDRQRVCRT
jgi:hypothetical protein